MMLSLYDQRQILAQLFETFMKQKEPLKYYAKVEQDLKIGVKRGIIHPDILLIAQAYRENGYKQPKLN